MEYYFPNKVKNITSRPNINVFFFLWFSSQIQQIAPYVQSHKKMFKDAESGPHPRDFWDGFLSCHVEDCSLLKEKRK